MTTDQGQANRDYLAAKDHETNEDVFLDDGSFVHHPPAAESQSTALKQHLDKAHHNWENLAADKLPTKMAHEALHRSAIEGSRERADRWRPTDTWPDRVPVEGIAHGVPASAQSVTCHKCGERPSAHKVGEETGPINVHNLTAYLCCRCFAEIMGPAHDDHPYDEQWANQSPFRDLFTGADWPKDEPLAPMQEAEVERHISAGHYDRFLDRLLRPLMARRRYLKFRLHKETDVSSQFEDALGRATQSVHRLARLDQPVERLSDVEINENKFGLEALAAVLEAELERRGQGSQDTASEETGA